MIRIQTTPLKLEINRSPGQMTIEQGQADLQIDTTLPEVEITTTDPQMTIDQSAARADAGLKNLDQALEEAKNLAKQAAANYAATVSGQGDALAQIHDGADQIVEQAIQNAWKPEDEWNIASVPSHPPVINVERGTFDVQLKRAQFNLTANPTKTVVDYQRGKVDIYVKQKNNIDIQFDEEV